MKTSKQCFKCGAIKPLDAFHKHKGMADGHLNKCKECTCKDVRENRKKNIVYYRNYDRKRASQPERVEQRRQWDASWHAKKDEVNAHQREYRKNNPEKNSARGKVSYAIIQGKLKKLPCEICGSTNVHAHHEDYSRPLDVIWLCPKHHSWIHG